MIGLAVLIGAGFALLAFGFVAAIVASTRPAEPSDRIDPEEWRRSR